jgi:hypothetical protein
MNKRHLFQWFRLLCQQEIPATVQAVIVLSGPPTMDANGNVINEYSPENIARIAFGIHTILMVADQKRGGPYEEATFGDGPHLILNGDEKQIEPMKEIVRNLGFPLHRVMVKNCGSREESNTKVQLERMASDPICLSFQDIVLITHEYHALRVALTAKKHLPTDCHYTVRPVPNGYMGFFYNKFQAYRKEIAKIQEYADRGDIANAL